MNKKFFFTAVIAGALLTFKLLKTRKTFRSDFSADTDLNPPENYSWQHGFLKANGIKFHYVTQGEGPLLLLLHGFPETWYTWHEQIPLLAEKYKVVAPDLRGYNLSDKPGGVKNYQTEILVKDIKEIIKELGYEKATVVGHDWGGVVAWWLSMLSPESVEKLVILNAPHPIAFIKALRSSRQIFKSWYMLFFQLPLLPEILINTGQFKYFAKILKNTSTKPEKAFSKGDLEHLTAAWQQGGAVRGMLNYYRALRYNTSKPRQIDAPTLLLWGEKDTALLKQVNQGIEKYVPDISIKYLPGGSHWVHRDDTENVNQHLKEFLFTE